MIDPFDPLDEKKSDLQKEILRAADRNPDMTPKQIADTCDCSASYVRETLNEYRSGLLDL